MVVDCGCVDGDGAVDAIFPVCEADDCSLHIAYNDQIPLCNMNQHSDCRSSQDLCVADDRFNISFTAKEVSFHNFLSIIWFNLPSIMTRSFHQLNSFYHDLDDDISPNIQIEFLRCEMLLGFIVIVCCQSITPIPRPRVHALDPPQR